MDHMWVVMYDQGLDGAADGFIGVFSSEQKAKEYIDRAKSSGDPYYLYSKKIVVDQE